MNFEDIYTIIFVVFLLLMVASSKKIKHAFINCIKHILNPSLLFILLEFIFVLLLINHLAALYFKTNFISIFFIAGSIFTYLFSFEDLYYNDDDKLKSIIQFAKNTFKFSIFYFFIDILFVMDFNIILMFLTAIISTIIFALTTFSKKTDFHAENAIGYDYLIILTNSIMFYFPFGILAYNSRLFGDNVLIYIINIISLIIVDLFSGCSINDKKISLSNKIKIFYITIYLIIVPKSFFINNILLATIFGNSAILVATFISLLTTRILTSFYKYRRNKRMQKLNS